MKLFVDDIRDIPNEDWTLARTIGEAIRFIAMYGNRTTHISLDHDISHYEVIDYHNTDQEVYPCNENFSTVAYFIGAFYDRTYYRKNTHLIPHITVHSANPEGAKNISSILARYNIDCKIKEYK